MRTFLTPPKTLRFKFILYMGIPVTFFIALIFFGMYLRIRKDVYAQLDEQSHALLDQVIVTREWIADHGGIYVIKRPGMEENPFLPGTNIEDLTGRIYMFRNPAMATREISDYAQKTGHYRFHLTSLKVKNPANTPLPFEEEALRYFEDAGYEECREGLVSMGMENGVMTYCRTIPLLVEQSCLGCHADQGYKLGEVRGGLSVIIPMEKALATISRTRNILIFSWFAIVSLLSGVIYILLHKLVLRPVGHLHDVAQSLIDGQYTVQARLSTGDEFESLGQALNNMTERLKRGYEGSIKSLVAAVDARDPYTKGHTSRVARYATAIAREMKLSPDKLEEIELGAILHDIGKIGVADTILRKFTPLASAEVRQMKDHVEKGAAIINDAEFLMGALPAVLYHHERHDGKGYPAGLHGEDIPLIARIVAVADSFDAMTTDRPYRMALPPEHAVIEIEKNAERQFDPAVVKAFRRAFAKRFKYN